MSSPPIRKKLIEVALPLDVINAESAREKSIRQGHPSTLHLWWARRPLAACRAVLFSQLVDDPSAHPELFPTEEAQDVERERLFRIIEDLVKWENSTNETVLEAARAEIRRSCGGNPPAILDPFAGGGSIPLEAQRLGLEAYASDLNPVAVLINKALIEVPSRWADYSPVHPDAGNRTRWKGAEGLAEDVRKYGNWMRDEAERRVGHLYPKARLPDGSQANVIAWIWARTVICPNPACGATMPLVRSFWLGKKKGKEAWVNPIINGKAIRFEVGHRAPGPAREGTIGRRGAECLACSSPVKLDHVRREGRAGRMGVQLMAVVVQHGGGRIYLAPTDEHAQAAEIPRPVGVPEGQLPTNPRDFKTPNYGLTTWADLFTTRQLTVLVSYSDLVEEVKDRVEGDAAAAGLPSADSAEYGRAIALFLALISSRTSDQLNALARWSVSRDQSIGLFARHAIPMVWDFAEVNPFAGAAGDLDVAVKSGAKALEGLRPAAAGHADQGDARLVEQRALISTDPPYYDNIGYSDLSDFFYVWLRRSLASEFPSLLGTMLTPKTDELIATPYRHGGSSIDADRFFEDGFVDVFRQCRSISPDGYPITLFYAFKQSEDSGDDGVGSTGWSTMLEGLLSAGLMVTATWPVRTERGARTIAIGTNSLASSVVLACRPRSEHASITDRQGFVRSLEEELPQPVRDLQKAHIAPVDLRQAAIGPGMAVFSRFARVIEPDGGTMRVRTALGLINQALDRVLDEQEQDFDAETRWAIHWFSQFFFDQGSYGTAEQLAVSMNVAVGAMVDSGILQSGGGKARLLTRAEMPESWNPEADLRKPVWEITQHLVKRLEIDGEESAARLLRRLGGMGELAQLLAYRLYTVCERTRPSLAGPYNALVASWPEIQRLAREGLEPITEFEQQSFDT